MGAWGAALGGSAAGASEGVLPSFRPLPWNALYFGSGGGCTKRKQNRKQKNQDGWHAANDTVSLSNNLWPTSDATPGLHQVYARSPRAIPGAGERVFKLLEGDDVCMVDLSDGLWHSSPLPKLGVPGLTL